MKAIIKKLRDEWKRLKTNFREETNSWIKYEIKIQAADEILEAMKPCVWTRRQWHEWATGCGEYFTANLTASDENELKYCPYCSGEIEEAK